MLINSVLTIGFVFLLALIWLIGSRSVNELQAISNLANDISRDYQNRLTKAGKIQEEEVNLIAQVQLVRSTRLLPVPIKPFDFTLNEARQNFDKAFEDAKKFWADRTKQQTIRPAELIAWRDVEAAVPEFLSSIEKLALEEKKNLEKANGGSASSAPDSSSGEPKFDLGKFKEVRSRIDEAISRLVKEINADRDEFLTQIARKQLSAAAEVSQVRWFAFLFGLLVAVIVFMIIRSRILELRQAIGSARAAQDFARSVFDSQSNDILVMAENGELLAVNQAFFKRYHLRPSELLLQDYRGALAHLPEIALYIRSVLQLSNNPDESIDKTVTHRQRIELKTKRGPRQSQGFPPETRVLDVYVSPLTIDREIRGRVVVLVDVTEEERVREELRRNRTLSAVGQITAQVAHELYNPIGAIKLNIELLEMQLSDSDEDLRQTAARLKRGAEHLSTIVMDLRYLTRPRDPERKPTNLNQLMDEVVELASDRLDRARTTVVRQYAENLQAGNFDPQQLRKVFLNLLINAVEASPQNSQVILQTAFVPNGEAPKFSESNGQHGALQVSVVDFGSGMSEETRNRIFEAFYTTKKNGTGLGMMITHEIIKKHNGKIEIESEEGTGTKVSVFLPV
ncbi:MAG TPA: ATP-binding protein [Blastocatellia bacterium]|nr:ATP-binding protein [Blastocatellia bacterium]